MMGKIIAVVAAHPDDEVLGCGGTIAKHIESGDEVHVLILSEGITSRDEVRNRDERVGELSQLADTAHKANEILGTTSLSLEDLPDNRMDSIDRLDIVKLIEKFIGKYLPSVVYTHHSGDVNVDHRRLHEAVVTACRPVPGRPTKTLLFYETTSSTEWQPAASALPFSPNWFQDVSSTVEIKLRALQVYQSEMRDFPHSRSLEAVEYLARWRGASVGVNAAEAFVLGRNIIVDRDLY